uniref:Uncharacterized protein n=1 Tax=Arundo donax TaxID=35708 RepID=A0A0A9AJA4_ARUDO
MRSSSSSELAAYIGASYYGIISGEWGG